jgi:hypothetical protein
MAVQFDGLDDGSLVSFRIDNNDVDLSVRQMRRGFGKRYGLYWVADELHVREMLEQVGGLE